MKKRLLASALLGGALLQPALAESPKVQLAPNANSVAPAKLQITDLKKGTGKIQPNHRESNGNDRQKSISNGLPRLTIYPFLAEKVKTQ